MKYSQNIDPISLTALRLTLTTESGGELSTATGFVVAVDGQHYLVSNWHVFSGRDPDTRRQISQPMLPDAVSIMYQVPERMRHGHGVWTARTERLVDDQCRALWFEHPQIDRREFVHPETWEDRVADVAILPLRTSDDVAVYPVDRLESTPDVLLRPGLPVHIVGYPFGRTSSGLFPIWKTGHIASDMDNGNERYFLVDATTKPGMSGSPVVFRPMGEYLDSGGRIVRGDPNRSVFLGVYAGRISAESDIGIVWRPHIILEAIANRAQPRGV